MLLGGGGGGGARTVGGGCELDGAKRLPRELRQGSGGAKIGLLES